MKTQEILILGAGVSGLSTGILLLKRGYKVSIWAKDLPPNTTSDKAAAFWYPYLCSPKEKASRWAKLTLNYLHNEIMRDIESGCLSRKVTEVFDKKVGEPWWKEAVVSYSRPLENQLPQGYVDGYEVEGVLMDTSIYMDYLVKKFQGLDGTLTQKEVADVNEPLGQSSVVINCTGLGSRALFDDKLIYPVRGQVVKVKPNGFDRVIADDESHNSLAYIIPRINDIVLGGTAQVDNWNLEVDPHDTKEILRKCAALNSRFEHVEIIESSVGLRPTRNEIRLESEDYEGKTVIHNYGHGGAGFTLSWGCAQDVVAIVENL